VRILADHTHRSRRSNCVNSMLALPECPFERGQLVLTWGCSFLITRGEVRAMHLLVVVGIVLLAASVLVVVVRY
jgi:hypothetical protein